MMSDRSSESKAIVVLRQGFAGSKPVFSSDEPRAVADYLIQNGGYRAPRMMDAGLVVACKNPSLYLLQGTDSLNRWIEEHRTPVAIKRGQAEDLAANWLWGELMDWCKSTGSAPANNDRLFQIVGRLREQNFSSVAGKSESAVIPDKESIFNWLQRKYTQQADERQKGLGLVYMTAETHDLADEIHKMLAEGSLLTSQHEQMDDKLIPSPPTGAPKN